MYVRKSNHIPKGQELSEKIPEKIFKHCISLALIYHELKKIPLLGA